MKNQIEAINGGKRIKYKNDLMGVKFKLNHDLLLSKILSISSMIIVVQYVLQKDNKYYPQVYLHECLYDSVNEF